MKTYSCGKNSVLEKWEKWKIKTAELANGIIYLSYQTKFQENAWANELLLVWSDRLSLLLHESRAGSCPKKDSFTDVSSIPLITSFALNTVISWFLTIFSVPIWVVSILGTYLFTGSNLSYIWLCILKWKFQNFVSNTVKKNSTLN